jgi:hypothetical protein
MPVDASKAKTLLGWTQRPLSTSIADCADSLVAVGEIKAA